ncbi:aspartate aminotransferase family protein [Vibrio sp. D404a]|uniref:aspartate aminotransferase family protein n=1 Tax=unclassified Vibrio TaxID=2614977 RepID=UPI002554BD9E|nr:MULTISPECIES: aspartate aminotransferase family protein [unclassified Vibrio]MDK9735694.1 aspartate aminotransferase family protein [Vibrio sp. D404a]MDK9798610.1 aspartate aminotransferase family protein [Vibrio sp. D449a]
MDLLSSEITNQDVIELDKNVFHSWSVQESATPIAIARGQGCTMWDFDGSEYLDFSSQLVNTNIGHQHPKVIEALKMQADTLATIAPATANLTRGIAAKKILERAPSAFKKVFFTNAGADANENAIRMARQFTGRDKVLSAYRSYHGNTGSAIAATGDFRRVPNEYSRGHVHFFNPYLYRTEFNATSEIEECERALAHLERVIECEGPGSIAAILLETIPGTAGFLLPPEGYLQGVRDLATKHGIQLIFDEVMVGFGRTGKWFAFEHFNVTPDLVTFAKGVNSGYVPVGGVLVSEAICDFFKSEFFMGGLTYSGHPLAMSTIVAAIDAMEEEGIIHYADEIGNSLLGPSLIALMEKRSIIGNIRGKGMFWAVELVEDRATKEPLSNAKMGQIKQKLTEQGLLTFIVNNRIHVTPPLIIKPNEIKDGVAIIDEVLSQFD